jgi:hypothetical protein
MKKIKKIVDERQELELLKIEHVCFWIAFWALCISIIVQSIILEVPFKQFAAEWITFMIMCVGVLIGSVKKGVWDYYTEPSMKTYLFASLSGSAVFAVLFAISKYANNDYFKDAIGMLLLITLILFIAIFIAIFALSAIMGKLVQRKRKLYEQQYGSDE